jgi:[ribosomal protein S5]-alanine N-acetyltransferase
MHSRSTSLAGTIRRRGFLVYLRAPRLTDASAFLAATKASRRLHGAWVQPPSTLARFKAFVHRYGQFMGKDVAAAANVGFLVCRCRDDAIVGVFNLGEVVHGQFQSAYVGYYAFAPHAGSGLMTEGLGLLLHFAFRNLKLHRVEANIQPRNLRSLALVRQAGFVREGYSRRYVRVGGRWRDHVRMALLVEDWRKGQAMRA